ncbi:probable glutamate receptor [Diachasma alloeum]|uniref:Ionotropic receptor 118 n=1 Tax=Diachasma alloeum TaxID=454923 RepID=A0A4E0RJR3_9HYME|nr:probable glutamate receptor [Diachasma alloeum]THK32992.1 ionotropic receptor 118 [Diachasma alloeum]
MINNNGKNNNSLSYKKGINFSISLILLETFFSAASVLLVKATEESDYHTPLIRDIYDQRGTCGIVLASAENYQSFGTLTIWHGIFKTLSDEGIPTLMISFEQFEDRFEFYAGLTVRPLAVIIFVTIGDVQSFSEISRDLDMSYAVWLLLFMGDASPDVCEFCHSPSGNLLNLKYDSEVVVSCCKSNIIQEWWSTLTEHTNSLELGRWTAENRGIEWFFNDSLYSRRHSMEGQEFRIAATSVYFWERNSKYYGFLGEILRELSDSLNFTIPQVNWGTSYGAWNPETSSWTGIIGKLENNEADLAVSEFRITQERLNVVDYTVPIGVGGTRLYLRKLDAARLQWNAYFKAFSMDVWMVIIGLILTIPIFLTLMRYKRKHYYLLPLALEHYLSIWGIYCQQGLSEFPKPTSLRIVYLSIFISALVSSGAYSASLISFLAVSSSYSPFSTIEEFVEDGSYQLIVLKNSPDYYMYKTSNQTLMKKMMSLMKPTNLLPDSYQEGFEQVCTKRVVFYTHEAIRRAMVNLIPCEITAINTGKTETLGMALPRGSEWRGLINYQIRRFGDNGMLQRLGYKYFTEYNRNELRYPSVHLQGIIPIVAMLGAGFLIASIIFIIETIFCSSKKKSLNPRRRKSF